MNINEISSVFDGIDAMRQWADSHDTSEEIAYAIAAKAADLAEAERIWGDPTADEMASVSASAWAAADQDVDELFWGQERLTRAAATPPPVRIAATITYTLSEAGRRESLRRGGDGKAEQTLTGEIAPDDLDFFSVSRDGGPSLALAKDRYAGKYATPGNATVSLSIRDDWQGPHLDEQALTEFDHPFKDLPSALHWERSRISKVESLLSALAPELERRKAKYLSQEEEKASKRQADEAAAKARAEAATQKQAQGVAALAAWSKAHGSALLKARLEEEFEWRSLARQEYANAVLAAAGLPEGEEADKDWYGERCKPSLDEINTLRRIRQSLSGPAVASLVWLKIERDEGEFGGEETGEILTPWDKAQSGLLIEMGIPDDSEVWRLIPLSDIA